MGKASEIVAKYGTPISEPKKSKAKEVINEYGLALDEGLGVGPAIPPTPESEESMYKDIGEAAVDVAITAPNVAMMELGDEALGLVSPEAGEWYKQKVKEARERSPVATTIQQFTQPDAMSAFRMAKMAKKIGEYAPDAGIAKQIRDEMLEDAASSAMVQYGTEGDVTFGQTIASPLVGQVIRAPFKAMAAKSKAARASSTGMAEDVQDMANKSGIDDPTGIQKTEETIKYLEDRGYFNPNHVLDEKSLTFIPANKMAKAKSLAIPASKDELISKSVDASKKVSKKLDDALEDEAMATMDMSGDIDNINNLETAIKKASARISKIEKKYGYKHTDTFEDTILNNPKATQSDAEKFQRFKKELGTLPQERSQAMVSHYALSNNVRSGDKGVFSKEDIFEYDDGRIQHIIESGPYLSGAEREAMKKEVANFLEDNFRGGEIDLPTLNKMKQQIYKRINYDANVPESQFKVPVWKQLARTIKDMVNENVTNKKVIEYNEFLEKINDVTSSLVKRRQKQYGGRQFSAGMGSGSLSYRAASALEKYADPVAATSAQISKTLRDNPKLREGLMTPFRKVTPAFMTEDPLNEKLDSIKGTQPQRLTPEEPQASIDPMSGMDLSGVNTLNTKISDTANIPMQLQKMQLPRDVESFMQDPKMALMKIAQEAPEEYQGMEDIMLNFPERMADVLPTFIQKHPQMFARDSYERVNHVVPDWQSQGPLYQLAYDDITNNPNLSESEKYHKKSLLNREGKLYDEDKEII
jgi:hypothetical protein